jgi:mannose-6-phosphate isomerase-like protein (cupin superfamily)
MPQAMKRLSILALVFGSWMASAQIITPVYKDPTHRQALYVDALRVLEVTLPAAGASLEHLHERDIATIAIAGGMTRVKRPGQDWEPPRDRVTGTFNVTEYAGMPGAHTIENLGTTPYRLVAVENQRQAGWSTTPPIMAPGTTLNRQTRAFNLYDIRLDAATPESAHDHQVPTVTVVVSGVMENQGDGGTEPFQLQPGRWTYTPMHTGHTLRATGGAAHAVEFEAR